MKYIIKWIAHVCKQCTFIFKTINTICMLYDDLKVLSQMNLSNVMEPRLLKPKVI
jgi:hypothetical protein